MRGDQSGRGKAGWGGGGGSDGRRRRLDKRHELKLGEVGGRGEWVQLPATAPQPLRLPRPALSGFPRAGGGACTPTRGRTADTWDACAHMCACGARRALARALVCVRATCGMAGPLRSRYGTGLPCQRPRLRLAGPRAAGPGRNRDQGPGLDEIQAKSNQ